jgi:aldose 1-epimerase
VNTELVTELRLHLGGQTASLSTLGGRVLGYEVAGRTVIEGSETPESLLYRSSLLVPWPNRVTAGRWEWRGVDLQLPVNEQPLGTALHGLVAYAHFSVAHQTATTAAFVHELERSPGYPFSLSVEAEYSLTGEGLECVLRARNTGDDDAPVALGVHPYLFTRGPVDDVTLRLPAEMLLLGSPTWDEIGRREVGTTDLDFREPRPVGSAAIDACWTDVIRDADGRVTSTVGFPGGDSVDVWGGATCRYLVVYNGDTLPGDAHRRSIAVEPCTAPANALRSGTDLDVLAPGSALELRWGVSPSWL